MADNERKVLRIPRSILAEMTKNNPQAIKALEGLQSGVFELLPQNITEIIERAAADAMQAAMMANQLRDQLPQQLQAVSVPLEQSNYLQAVNGACDCSYPLQAI